jgi:hypothetical protein
MCVRSRQVSMCQACDITCVDRIEKSRRYLLNATEDLTHEIIAKFTGNNDLIQLL